MIQDEVWVISIILMGILLAVFVFVYARSQAREDDYTPLQTRAYKLRTVVFWVLVFTIGPAMIYNLVDLPYDIGRDASTPPQIIDVKGYQWRWEMSRDQVEVGQLVEFRVTAADVNHGFGIYDTNLRLIAQTQAMPGYTNVLRHTFDKEGTYRILCMEYCGLAHHNMLAEIKVVKSGGAANG